MSNYINKYLIYTFSLSWILWGIIIIANQFNLLQYGSPLFYIFFIGGGVAPPICAILLKKKYSTNVDYKSFLTKIINPKHHFGWYIFVIGLAFAYMFLPILIGEGSITGPLYIVLLAFPSMILGGGLEEVGWRGLLLPALQEKYSVITSTVIVSIIWACWHIPLFYISGTSQASINFLWFFIDMFSISFLLSLIYNATGSILLCITFHALTNAFYEVVVIHDNLKRCCIMLLFSIMIFIVIGMVTQRKTKQKIVTTKSNNLGGI
jgi:membrane protease YdiL (CAAX protease family)